MAALTIKWTRQAIADVDNIYDFMAAHNLAAARATLDRIDRAIDSLALHPQDWTIWSRGRIEGAGRRGHAVYRRLSPPKPNGRVAGRDSRGAPVAGPVLSLELRAS